MSENFFADELKSIHDYLDAVGAALEEGLLPDMIGFEKRVGDWCQRLLSSDQALQKKFTSELPLLLGRLNLCEQQLQHWHEKHMKSRSETP